LISHLLTDPVERSRECRGVGMVMVIVVIAQGCPILLLKGQYPA